MIFIYMFTIFWATARYAHFFRVLEQWFMRQNDYTKLDLSTPILYKNTV